MNLDAGGGPSEPSLRARLALAGNRSPRYAPAGSSNVTGWCSGMPASSLGARPAVIIQSEEIRGVESFRRAVGYLDERHVMPLSINARPWLAFVTSGVPLGAPRATVRSSTRGLRRVDPVTCSASSVSL